MTWLRRPACLASLVFITAGCASPRAASDLPLVVTPDRRDTLSAQPVPATVSDAIDILSRGLSGADMIAFRVLNEDDAIASSGAWAWMQKAWGLKAGGQLRRTLEADGFTDAPDMADALLRSFWRRLHDRPLDLPQQAREARAVRTGEKTDGHWVLLSESAARHLSHYLDRPMPFVTGTWMPDAGTLRRVEQVLMPALEAALAESRRPGLEDLRASDYYRQYAGIALGGRKLVYINGFHREELSLGSLRFDGDAWRTAPILVADGGWAFFGAVFDPATGRIGPIGFHGLRAR
jgi:hypothetical protein